MHLTITFPLAEKMLCAKYRQNSCHVPLCCFKTQGSKFDPQLALSSAVLINLEVVIIMNEYCSFQSIALCFVNSLCFSASW